MSHRNRINPKGNKQSDNPWHRSGPDDAFYNVSRQQRPTKSSGAGSKATNPPPAAAKKTPTADENFLKHSEEKFNQAHRKHVESAKKYTQHYESSEEEDEGDSNNQDILVTVFKNYSASNGDIGKTQEYLQNLLESRSAVCLICIGTVKRADAIWSCKTCYTFFHLLCIQRWANDSISQKRISHELQEGYYNNRGEYVPKPTLSVHWDCPKCRKEYEPVDIPRHYECFCGHEQNPQNHVWLIPHSCGETCRKKLVPDCGHRCVLLCHPGPCPPCPQTISVACKCGQSAAKTIRCSQRSWTCLKTCKLKRNCGIHECGEMCHAADECPPCKSRSRQKCLCGNKVKEVNCSEAQWQCGKVCGKQYDCGLHRCEKVCHDGGCGECPQGLPRTCPCGKTSSVASCSEDIGTCGDTCQKFLDCQIHRCSERCHQGNCGQCVELIRKSCRCGNTSKEVACYKQLNCETKCKNIKSCNKHPCNRKCCDGDCLPCDKLCGKTLPCGKHKCSSLCHHGPCYPCNQKATVKCRCGGTTVEVPCGREKKVGSPKCRLPCRIHSKCHHSNPHNCHQGDCPPCQQICGLVNDTTNCEHPCAAKCHDAVRVVTKDKNFKPVGPWDVPMEIVEIKQLPHPPCEVKVSVTCIGGHEAALWPCYNSKPTSCGRPCGRALRCGVHTCQLQCHAVKRINSTEQDPRCQSCDADCLIPRPAGCVHPCKRPCHPAPCNPCQVPTKTSCHCGLTQIFYKCHEFNANDKTEAELKLFRESILSCGQKCMKNFPCGHRCNSTCHSGECPNPEQCSKKVKISCDCRNRKVDVNCNVARSKSKTLECDESCAQLKEIKNRELAELELHRKQQQEAENQRALEEYEKKFGRKKYRERKRVQVEDSKDSHLLLYVLSAAGCIIVAVVGYFFFTSN
ncbi:NF-X1-type zinc finger protein NFXL1 [Wyeomyia smithii]|uniref:NF-X1-type zinc finger protein NFXL1 n=1 Tax=Wyeomyia smithii TaxID=174621 RepID=UPI002467BE6D|nr:NF-X1-type zinc finger protein NFXL1 [Wyeomyia smithii]